LLQGFLWLGFLNSVRKAWRVRGLINGQHFKIVIIFLGKKNICYNWETEKTSGPRIIKTRIPASLLFEERNWAMSDKHDSSTVTDTEFDIIEELKATLDDIEEGLKALATKDITEKISYLQFLIHELDDTLSGQFKALRYKRFITKKSR
jgi:hypothetical protein